MPRDLFSEAGIAPDTSPSGAPRDLFAGTDLAPQSGPLGYGLSNINTGLAQAADLPSSIANLYTKYVGAPVSSLISGHDVAPMQAPMASPALTGAMTRNGMINPADLTPQNDTQKYVGAGLRGVGSAIPFMALGGAPSALGMAKMGVSGFGSGMSGQAGADVANKYGINPDVGSFVGGMAGGLGASGAANMAERGVNAAMDNLTPLAQSYKDLGIRRTLLGNTSENPTLQQAQAAGANMPISAGPIGAQMKGTMQDFGNALEQTAQRMGGATSLQEAGTSLKSGADAWMTKWKADQGTAWTGVDAAMGNAPVDLTGIQQTLATLKAKAAGNPEVENFLSSPLAKQAERIIASTGTVAGQPFLPWDTVRALRTRIGEHLENPALVADAGGAQAKMLYGALSEDMSQAVANSGNPTLQAQFTAANKLSSDGHALLDGPLGSIMRASTPEAAASQVLTNAKMGGSNVATLRATIPDALDEVGALYLRQAGKAPESAFLPYSPSRYLSSLYTENRLAPDAYQALFPNAEVQQRLANLDRVAKSMTDTERFLNTSKTGLTNSLTGLPMQIGAGAIMGSKAGEMLGGAPGGIAGGIIGGAGTPALYYGIGKMTTSPMLNALAGAQSTPSAFAGTPLLRHPTSTIGGLLGLLSQGRLQ